MQVLVEFTFELQDRVKDVGPIILSEVYRIFDSEAVFNVKTRSCSIDILNSLLKSTRTHIPDPNEQSAMLNPVLPSFIEKMIRALTLPNGQTGDTSSFTLKTEILKVFTYMTCEMPKFIQPTIQSILPPLWSLLTQMAEVYVKSIVNEDEELFGGNEGKSLLCNVS